MQVKNRLLEQKKDLNWVCKRWSMFRKGYWMEEGRDGACLGKVTGWRKEEMKHV